LLAGHKGLVVGIADPKRIAYAGACVLRHCGAARQSRG
jgi:hypothetical protein